MIYEFKSKATGNLIMTEAVGDMVLRAAGRTPAAQGVITVSAIPGTLATLRNAITDSKRARPAAAASEPDDDETPVGLAARALPFVEMLERSLAGGKDIVWGA